MILQHHGPTLNAVFWDVSDLERRATVDVLNFDCNV